MAAGATAPIEWGPLLEVLEGWRAAIGGADAEPAEDRPLLPSQFYAPRRLRGTEKMLLYVFWQALWDLRSANPRLQRSARRYFSFTPIVRAGWVRRYDAAFICEHFDWNLDEIRKALGQLRLIESASADRRQRPSRPYHGVRQRRLARG